MIQVQILKQYENIYTHSCSYRDSEDMRNCSHEDK